MADYHVHFWLNDHRICGADEGRITDSSELTSCPGCMTALILRSQTPPDKPFELEQLFAERPTFEGMVDTRVRDEDFGESGDP